MLRRELQLFPDWYLARHLGVELEGETLARWQRICDLRWYAARWSNRGCSSIATICRAT